MIIHTPLIFLLTPNSGRPRWQIAYAVMMGSKHMKAKFSAISAKRVTCQIKSADFCSKKVLRFNV
jgi:hypothetical protein